ERRVLLGGERLGQRAAVRVIEAAHGGGDGEAGRHGHARARHLREPRALAAERVLHVAAALGASLAEEVDESLAGPGPAGLRVAAGLTRFRGCPDDRVALCAAHDRVSLLPRMVVYSRPRTWPPVTIGRRNSVLSTAALKAMWRSVVEDTFSPSSSR